LEDYLIDYMSPEIWDKLRQKVDELLENPGIQQYLLKQGFIEHLNRANKNTEILKNFLKKYGWKVRK